MSGQTSYSINTANAVAGLVADIGFNEIDSFIAEVEVAFGIIVSRGTNSGQCDPGIGAGAGLVLGVSVRDLAREGALNSGDVSYAAEDVAAVMRSGQINVVIPSGGSAGDVLNFVDATGVIDAGVAIAGETDLTGWTLEADVVAGAVGVIRLP